MGEAKVVVPPVDQAGEQGVVLASSFVARLLVAVLPSTSADFRSRFWWASASGSTSRPASTAASTSSLMARRASVACSARSATVLRCGVLHVDQLSQAVGVAQGMRDVGVGVVRGPRVMHRHTLEPRQDLRRVHPLGAPLACTVSRTSVAVDAECIQASFPAVRSPVSSKCATSAPAIRSVITGIT